MKHNYLSVSSIFAQPGQYVVPIFQRPYVWTEDEQWIPLWADIRRIAEDFASGKDVPRSHFLGSVVLELQHTAAGHLASREIIDGQQRLTTLQLFLKAAADSTSAAGASLAAGQLADLTKNRHVPPEDENGRFKVWPTESDQPAFRAVMDSDNGEVSSAYSQHPFALAYKYFALAIRDWLGGAPGMTTKRADALSTALHQQIKIMALDIDQGEDAQVIFETLNARGTPLLPLDLVKNWLLREAVRKKDNVKKLYEHYWRKPFDHSIEYWREEVGRGHAQRPRADLFLQNFLTIRLKKEIAGDRLYYHFLDDVEQYNAEPIVERVATIKRYSEFFRDIESPDDDSELGARLARIKELDFVTTYPLLMALRAVANDDALSQLLIFIESFIVRRLVCNLSTRSYGTLFVETMKAVIEEGGSLQDRLLSSLLKSDSEAARWPNDTEFRKAWMEAPLYEKFGKPRLRFILRALEEKIRVASELTEPFSVPAKLEIEHIMPQSWEANWPLPDGEGLGGKVAEARRTIVHTIGNLTLLTKKLNAKLSNAAWAVGEGDSLAKRETIKEYSLMMLSKDVVACPAWGEANIYARGEHLFQSACAIWPRP